jgi:hypothetical protein
MFDISNLRFVWPADALPGSVVAFNEGTQYVPALRVFAPDEKTAGLLVLPQKGRSGHATIWAAARGRVVVLSDAPRFQWNGEWGSLLDASPTPPLPGHLLVAGETLLISGIVPGLSNPSAPTYWNVKDGKVFSLMEYSASIAVSKWNLVLEGIDRKPHGIVSFPA